MTQEISGLARGAEPTGVSVRVGLRRLLAGLAVAAWLAWAVPSWMSSLHEVRAHELVADVRAGRVTGYQVVTNVRPDGLDFSSLDSAWYADVPAADAEGRPTDGLPGELIYVVDGDVRMRWLSEPLPVIGDEDPIVALRASGARPLTPETFPPNRDWAAFPALFAFLMALVGIISIPPTRGTRPFWVFAGSVGMGLGIAAYAVAELGWPRSPESDRTTRLRWWHGLLVAAVGGLVVAGLRAAIV